MQQQESPIKVEAPKEESTDPFRLLALTVYVAAGVGYLYSLITASHLLAGTVLLFTIIHVLWVFTFRYGLLRERDPGPGWLLLLMLLALSSLLTLWLGLGFDWLLPVVTAAIIGTAYDLKVGLGVTIVLYLCANLVLMKAQNWTFQSNNQLAILPPFIFAFSFAYTMRQLAIERLRGRTLLLALEGSKSELESAHTRLQAYAAQVEELAVVRERNRIAREIHDTLGHYLTLLAVQLETATRLEERADPGLHLELQEARRVTKECLTEVRHSVAALRPDVNSSGRLEEALQRLVTEFEFVSKQTTVTLDMDEGYEEPEPVLRMTLYRCVQEALTNIRKHAAASRVLLRLRLNAQQAELTILDNGRGSDAASVEQAPGFGLLGMRERVALLGGHVSASAEPANQGWRVEVVLPRSQSASTPSLIN